MESKNNPQPSWKTDELPERFEKWSEGWKRIHPDHTYLFWTDKTNRELVEAEFPWFLETYDKLPKNIHRADAVRYCYMYKYGGVYADLDVDALKPMNELFPKLSARYSRLSEEDKRNFVYDIDPDNPETWKLSYSSAAKPSEKQPVDLVLPLMSNDTKFIHNVPNAWMASKPGHSFWVWVLHKIQNTLKDPKNANLVEELTGPVALYETAIEWQKQRKTIQGVESDTGKNIFGEFNERIWFAPPGVIFPYDWTKAHEDGSYCSGQSPTFDANECIKKVTTEDSYSITYW
ncbi:hypothetical protein HK098_004891, partial [Nowakowskiella sp. JEL0407]